jgi:hypothetical protein
MLSSPHPVGVLVAAYQVKVIHDLRHSSAL